MVNLIVVVVCVLGPLTYSIIKAHKKWKKKLAVLKRERNHTTKRDFIEYFLTKGYTEESISFVYEKMQDFLCDDDLVLLPEDNFQQIYEIEEDEWSYMLEDWFKDAGKQMPSQQYVDYLNSKYAHVSFEYLIELIDDKTTVYNTQHQRQ